MSSVTRPKNRPVSLRFVPEARRLGCRAWHRIPRDMLVDETAEDRIIFANSGVGTRIASPLI
jgi:hypothetical protein